MVKFTVDIEFAPNGDTSETTEFVSRYFTDKGAATECYEYVQTLTDCSGASLTAWRGDYSEVLWSRNFGSYVLPA